MTERPILASSSRSRRALLEEAGIDVAIVPARIDERAVEAALDGSGAAPEDLARVLAEAKAVDVSERHRRRLVIGADQTLSLDGRILHKPADMAEARRRLLTLSGKTHHLHSAVVLAENGKAVWHHVSQASMRMRELDPGFIGRHLAAVGDAALDSVGAYQYEKRGIQLFDAIEGDHFTIVGLPLLPLLDQLRALGAIDG